VVALSNPFQAKLAPVFVQRFDEAVYTTVEGFKSSIVNILIIIIVNKKREECSLLHLIFWGQANKC